MTCTGCGRELVAHEIALFEAFKLAALHAGVDPVVAGVCEDCAALPCCLVCDRPIVEKWPHYACGKACSAIPGRPATCCTALCLRIHMMRHHREELVS